MDVKVPERPDEETVRQHELTHAKSKPWCEDCVFGKGDAAPHRGVQFLTDKEPEIVVNKDGLLVDTNITKVDE